MNTPKIRATYESNLDPSIKRTRSAYRRPHITSVCRVVVEPSSLFAFLRFPSFQVGEKEGGSFGIPLPRTNSNSRLFSVREKL